MYASAKWPRCVDLCPHLQVPAVSPLLGMTLQQPEPQRLPRLPQGMQQICSLAGQPGLSRQHAEEQAQLVQQAEFQSGIWHEAQEEGPHLRREVQNLQVGDVCQAS